MTSPLNLLNEFIGAILAYGRMARKAARRKKLAAMKRD
jgi:hypothetical protein